MSLAFLALALVVGLLSIYSPVARPVEACEAVSCGYVACTFNGWYRTPSAACARLRHYETPVLRSGSSTHANFRCTEQKPWYLAEARCRASRCSEGTIFNPMTGQCMAEDKPSCPGVSSTVGNPIDIRNGNKHQAAVDYEGNGLSLRRRYVHHRTAEEGEGNTFAWRFSYTDRITLRTLTTSTPPVEWYELSTSANERYMFSGNDVTGYEFDRWQSPPFRRIRKLLGDDGHTGWEALADNGARYLFGGDGLLTSIVPLSGRRLTVRTTYDDAGFPATVRVQRDGDEGYLLYALDARGLVIQATIHSGGETLGFSYEYDPVTGALTRFVNPDGAVTYHYEAPGFPLALTGITDERGVRYASWEYDSQGRAVASEHAGQERTTVSYGADGSTTVTNALGKQSTYRLQTIGGMRRIVRVEGHPTPSCEGANQEYSYTPDGLLAAKTDWNGVRTTYQYDERGLEISRTEAAGTPEARTITTEWHPTLNLPVKITEPRQITLMDYDQAGRLISRRVLSR